MKFVYKYAICICVMFFCGSIHVHAAAGASLLSVVETKSDVDVPELASEASDDYVDYSPEVDLSEVLALLQQLRDSCVNIEFALGLVNGFLEYVAGFGLFAVLIALLVFIYKFFRIFI